MNDWHLRDALSADPKYAGFERTHEPLVGAGGIRVTADFSEVYIQRAERLGALDGGILLAQTHQ